MTTALVSGVPVLVLPHYGDQPVNALRVPQLGAALTVPLGQISPESVKAAVSGLLDSPGYRQAAQDIAAENARQPTPADLVEVLRVLADHKASRS